MYLSGWDLRQAANQWIANSLHTNHELMGQFYRMRPALGRDIDLENPATLVAQGERLAAFINITGRSDWHSLRERLIEADWNLIEAVAAWYRLGVRPERPERSKGDSGIRMDVSMQPLKWPEVRDCEATEETALDEGWGQEPDLFNPSKDPQSEADEKVGNRSAKLDAKEDEKKEASKSKKASKKADVVHRDGFPVHFDHAATHATAHVGVPNPGLFLLEWISKGRYWASQFNDPRIHLSELANVDHSPSSAGTVPFDWTDEDHVLLLNDWRRRKTAQMAATNSPGIARSWSSEENDFLVTLTEELYQETKATYTGPVESLLPLAVSGKKKEEWAKRFNDKFSGTLQPGTHQTRAERKPYSLMAQRGRLQILIQQYKVNPTRDSSAQQADNATKVVQKRKGDPASKTPKKRLDPSGEVDTGQGLETTVYTARTGEDGPTDNETRGDDEADGDEGREVGEGPS